MRTARRGTLLVALLVGVLSAGPTATPAQSRRPNIVVIVADDMGYGDIGVHGARTSRRRTSIDRAERHAVHRALCHRPLLQPDPRGAADRALSAAVRARIQHCADRGTRRLRACRSTETTMADRLKAAGYRTAVFGKWHLGSADKFHPLERGFDEFFGFLARRAHVPRCRRPSEESAARRPRAGGRNDRTSPTRSPTGRSSSSSGTRRSRSSCTSPSTRCTRPCRRPTSTSQRFADIRTAVVAPTRR